MDRLKEMFELRNAIRDFLEDKLEADIQGAGISVSEPASSDISFRANGINYIITIDEL